MPPETPRYCNPTAFRDFQNAVAEIESTDGLTRAAVAISSSRADAGADPGADGAADGAADTGAHLRADARELLRQQDEHHVHYNIFR